jgi:hypothetical protein
VRPAPGGAGPDALYPDAPSNNTVTVNDDVPNSEVFFGTHGNVFGGVDTGTVDITNNRVTVNSGTMNNVLGGRANTGNAENNTVTVNNGTVNQTVRGGESATGSATGNRVVINGGTVLDPNGLGVSGGQAGAAGNATGNSVVINGGVLGRGVRGGSADDTGNATHNSVFIGGGTIGTSANTTNVTGGFSVTGSYATHNTVTISGSPDFASTGVATHVLNIQGGNIQSGGIDTFTGNTLNVWNFSGALRGVTNVNDFQYLNFVIPTNQGATPVLDLGAGTATLGDGAAGSTITASTMGGSAPLQPGANVTLIDGTINANGFNQTQATGWHGGVFRYNWDLVATASELTATLQSMDTDPAKALSEGFLAGLTLLNQNADLAAGAGMRAAREAGMGMCIFGAVTGAKLRHETGSHIDMSSLSFLAGLAWNGDFQPGRVTLGTFMEYGNGSYDTYNSFASAGAIHGDGDIYHFGLGILGRMDFRNKFYGEGSLRAGSVKNEYSSGDLGFAGADYDSSSMYYGVHLGGGYIWEIGKKASLDFYGKYFWTRQGSDSVTLSTGDRVRFKAADSHRTRVGSRFVYAVTGVINPYAGLAYEYEFEGKARASAYGYSFDAPNLRGGTGMGEIGLNLKPSADFPVSFDIGVQGYIGKREGVTGTIYGKYEF